MKNGSPGFDPSVSLFLVCEEAPTGNIIRTLAVATPLCLAFWALLISLVV